MTFAFTFVDAVTFVPPLFAVYQPLNVNPPRVGVGSVPTASPLPTTWLVGVTVPPFASNVTVHFSADVQRAKTISAPALYFHLPSVVQ